jgi:hypothetical protein
MISFTTDGEVLFEVYLPHAQDIQVLGDFTNWEDSPVMMLRGPIPDDGWWRATRKLSPGTYSFSYLVDGRNWMPDYAAAGVRRNASGRWTSVLQVEARIVEEPVADVRFVEVPGRVRVRPDREERTRLVTSADSEREFSTSRPSAHLHTA